MSAAVDAKSIAARIQGIIGGQDRGNLATTAARLGVSEVALRISIDPDSPHPTFAVLAAVIQHYGVDPTWLVTGEYDAATHRAAVDEDAAATRAQLTALLARQLPDDRRHAIHPDLRLEA